MDFPALRSLSFTSRISSPMFPVTDSTESSRWWLSTNLSPPIAAPEWTWGIPGSSTSSCDSPCRLGCLGEVSELKQHSPHTRCPIRQGLETGDHFPVG